MSEPVHIVTCVRCERTLTITRVGITTCTCGVRHHWVTLTTEENRG